MPYKILRGTDTADLTIAVNASEEEGWKPLGGVSFAQPGVMDLTTQKEPHPWAQAMVLEEPEK